MRFEFEISGMMLPEMMFPDLMRIPKFMSHATPSSNVRVSPCANGWLWVMGIAGFCDTLDSGDNNSLGVVTRKADQVDHKWEDRDNGGPVFEAFTSLKGYFSLKSQI